MKIDFRKYWSYLKLELKKTDFDIFDLIILLIPVLTFGYTLYVYFPGALTFDSYAQLTQIDTLKFSNGHPLFHTLIELVLLKIWNNPGIIGIFQISFFSIIWTLICKYNRRKIKSRWLIVLQILLTLFICINPINSIHSITLWKDILYSYMILLLSFCFQVCIDRRFLLKTSEIFWISLIIAIIPNLRHNGLIILVASVPILALILFIKDKRSKNWIKIIFFTIFSFILLQIPNRFLIEKDTSSSPFSIIYLQELRLTEKYLQENLFTEEEISLISSFIEIEDLSQYYNPYFLDPIGNVTINEKGYLEKNDEWEKILIKKIISNPEVFLEYFGQSTVIIWDMTLPSDTIGTILTIGYDATNNVNDISQIHSGEEILFRYNAYIDKLFASKYISIVFYSSAFYLYLSLILFVVIIVFSHKKENLLYSLILLPNITNLLGLAIFIPVQDTRYVYSSFLVGYLILLVFFREIFIALEKKKNI